jgi:hypothetical protein
MARVQGSNGPNPIGQRLAVRVRVTSSEFVRLAASTGTPDALGRLSGCLALRCPGVLSGEECTDYVDRVYRARGEWVANFDGQQFTLGRAWYTHLEEGREHEYFSNAGASDAAMTRTVAGLQERMLAKVADLVGGPVVRREGWCGPGVHIFPAGGEVARRGGEVHFDTEGLREAQIAQRVPALTFVLMLQPPEVGGGLRVWDRTYEGDDFPRKPDPSVPVARVEYELGELVVIDSYRLHQILPFRGGADRVTATVHAACEGPVWEAWF